MGGTHLDPGGLRSSGAGIHLDTGGLRSSGGGIHLDPGGLRSSGAGIHLDPGGLRSDRGFMVYSETQEACFRGLELNSGKLHKLQGPQCPVQQQYFIAQC